MCDIEMEEMSFKEFKERFLTKRRLFGLRKNPAHGLNGIPVYYAFDDMDYHEWPLQSKGRFEREMSARNHKLMATCGINSAMRG